MSQTPRNIFQDLIDIASGDLSIANTQIAEFTRFAERGSAEAPRTSANDSPATPQPLPAAEVKLR